MQEVVVEEVLKESHLQLCLVDVEVLHLAPIGLGPAFHLDFEDNVGHDTSRCPNNLCKKCGQTGHTKLYCMTHMKNLPLPNEIVVKILSYLSIIDLGRCAQVSKRLKDISTLKLNKEKTDDGFLKRLNSLMILAA